LSRPLEIYYRHELLKKIGCPYSVASAILLEVDSTLSSMFNRLQSASCFTSFSDMWLFYKIIYKKSPFFFANLLLIQISHHLNDIPKQKTRINQKAILPILFFLSISPQVGTIKTSQIQKRPCIFFFISWLGWKKTCCLACAIQRRRILLFSIVLL
jgi:hypothetical protein